MAKISRLQREEILFSSSIPKLTKEISRLEKAGQIRKIAPRVYTSNLTDTPETIVRRNLFQLIAHLFPGALISHRSALEFKPTATGNFFLTYTYTGNVDLPGIKISLLKGPVPLEEDNSFMTDLFFSQTERAFLENLQVSRKKGPESKTLSITELEEKLETIINVHGEDGLNKLRDKARIIASQLNMEKEFGKLNKIISAMLSTYSPKNLQSSVAKARAIGQPFDSSRLQLFEKLFLELNGKEFPNYTDKNFSPKSFRNFAFFEAYFSNTIEGTVFELNDAKKIIEDQLPMPNRDEDSHDVLGTFQLVANRTEMSTTPKSADELINILLYRHKILLSSRLNKHPGKFKEKNNRAGNTHFVQFDQVRGTLIRGFDFYQALTHPFAKALYKMFLVSEVHPFDDGNGRIARIMMNAELVKAKQSKIIIPTVYRDDYLGALKKISNQSDTSTFIRMMERAREFSRFIYDEDSDAMQAYLEECDAFKEHADGKLKIILR